MNRYGRRIWAQETNQSAQIQNLNRTWIFANALVAIKPAFMVMTRSACCINIIIHAIKRNIYLYMCVLLCMLKMQVSQIFSPSTAQELQL